jgi:hypothetical protein
MSYRLTHRPVKEEATEPQIPMLCLLSKGCLSPPHRTWKHSVVVVRILRAWYSEHLVSPYLHFQRNSSVTEAETTRIQCKTHETRICDVLPPGSSSNQQWCSPHHELPNPGNSKVSTRQSHPSQTAQPSQALPKQATNLSEPCADGSGTETVRTYITSRLWPSGVPPDQSQAHGPTRLASDHISPSAHLPSLSPSNAESLLCPSTNLSRKGSDLLQLSNPWSLQSPVE